MKAKWSENLSSETMQRLSVHVRRSGSLELCAVHADNSRCPSVGEFFLLRSTVGVLMLFKSHCPSDIDGDWGEAHLSCCSCDDDINFMVANSVAIKRIEFDCIDSVMAIYRTNAGALSDPVGRFRISMDKKMYFMTWDEPFATAIHRDDDSEHSLDKIYARQGMTMIDIECVDIQPAHE